MYKYFVTEEGKKVAYSDTGCGDTVVLLHGYLESGLVWGSLAESLGSRFRVVSIDLPGHGLSDIVAEIHTMDMMAEIVKGILDYLKISKVLMIGHSLGGYVTLAFLELFPESLAGYSIFHSQPFADSRESIERRNREIAVVRAGKKAIMYPGNIERMFSPHNLKRLPAQLKRSNEIASLTPDDGIIAMLKGMIARPSRQAVMEAGRVPLLWILGLHDQYIDYKKVTEGVRLPSNGMLVTLFDSGHLGFVEEPERSLSVLIDFASRVFGGDTRA